MWTISFESNDFIHFITGAVFQVPSARQDTQATLVELLIDQQIIIYRIYLF